MSYDIISCCIAFIALSYIAVIFFGPFGARGHCRISPLCFLAECHKRRLNQGCFVSAVCLVVCFLWFVLCLCVYFCDFIEFFPYCLFVSNSQVIGCEDCLRNDLYCVGWDVKLYSIQSNCCYFRRRWTVDEWYTATWDQKAVPGNVSEWWSSLSRLF